jgi:hypothetical protein
MDDNLSNEQAPDETLAPAEQQSEAAPKEETPKDQADTGTEGEGEAGDGDADPSDEDQEDEQPKRKRRSGLEKLRRQNERLEAELSTLRSQPTADSSDLEAAVRAKIGNPPKEDEFNGDYLAFERAMTAYETDKRLTTREVKSAHESRVQQSVARQQEAIDDYNDRMEEAAKAIPDLKTTIAKANVPVSDTVASLIIESEKGPLLAHHLAKNPSLAADLNRMPPLKAALEIGRLETRLSLPKPNGATKAPSPTNPPKGGAAPRPTPGQSMADYEKWRNS